MMEQKEVLLAFSGGIDSCAAVSVLRNQGLRVIALTLDTHGDESSLAQARTMAQKLDVELIVADVKERFEQQIVDYFVQSYISGQTPAPCTKCNPLIKWKSLIDYADWLGIERIATGHYFNIEQHNGVYFVARAADSIKDQSYYLWALPQSVLSRAVTPMGNLHKCNVEDYGRRAESMGVCFLRGKPYGELIKSRNALQPGDIVDKNGRVVGRHDSVALYTIGQRRGIGVEGVVIGIDGEHNRLVVGSDADLYTNHIELQDVVVADPSQLEANNIRVVVRGLGRNPDGFCTANLNGTQMTITLDNPAWAMAKGQPVVLYRDNIVVGGGWAV